MTPYERGALAAEMVSFLEELAEDPALTAGQQTEARRLIAAADKAWAKQ